ncbi:MAG: glycoside hydrolase family 2 TIM barrel-domain containing protein [bacterium]
MKKIIIVSLIIIAAMVAGRSGFAGELSRGAEFFLYDEMPGKDGRTDFYSGGMEGWGVEERIDYLKNYGEFLKKYFGGIKLDEYATYPDEIEKKIKELKPQPEPVVRRSRRMDRWRWALSDEGESLGWFARDFDDSKWEQTESLPKVVKGSETRDLWMRATWKTGVYDKAFVAFEGILGQSEIWVNGRKVVGPDACHSVSAPFKVDLTTWLEKNADNLIAIHVKDHKQRGESASPDEPSKYMGWGFVGRAELIETGAVFIDNAYITTKQLNEKSAELKLQFTLKNFTGNQFDGKVEATVRKWFPAESVTEAAEAVYPVSVLAGSGTDSPTYYALDFGTADSPVTSGYELVTSEIKYNAQQGYGWEKTDGLKAVDYPDTTHVDPVGADLKRDAVEGSKPAVFKLKTTPGLWAFEFVMGSPAHPVETEVNYIDTKVVSFGKDNFHKFEYSPVNATVFIRGNTASLKIGAKEKSDVFTINGLVAMNHVPREQRFEKPLALKNPEPWSPESPQLYELRLTVRDENGTPIDDIALTFGVVTLEDRYGDLFVNGRRYRIQGVLETHSFPPERDDDLYCIAPPDRWMAQDIMDNKKANVNMMRFHPAEGLGTNYPRWLEFADQFGMFVIWSPRQWFHWGNRAPEEFRPLMQAYTEPSMKEVRNHPSIFAWESGNETYYNDDVWDDRARIFSDEYYDLANSIDPSRFIIPISFWYVQFEGKSDFYRLSPGRGKELSYPGSGKSPRSFWASNVFWDTHPYPGWYGPWMEIWWGAGKGDLFKKDKVFMVSEFGAEGMPNWELYRDERYYHKWEESGSSAAKHEKARLGRNLDFSEWEISQAYQALVMFNNIAAYRTEDADGMSICTGAEGRHNGRYFKGLRDMQRRPKLAYYATHMAYRPIFIEALNGDMVISASDTLEPVIVNEGPARKVDVAVVFKDMSGDEKYRETLKDIDLPETGNLRIGRKIKPKNLKSGYFYYVEYIVTGKSE